MILRLLVLFLLGSLASAGPVTWDDSKCSDTCTQGRSSKYQYSEGKSYIYSYESSNELQADKASDLSVKLKAIVTLTIVSKCEAVLKVSSVQLQHGPQSDSSSRLVEELERNVLPFSWDDGKISHVCPNPSDSDQVNNIKKAILSTFQNTMRTFEHDAFNEETDILGSCDTEYKTKEIGVENYEITKTKNIPTCSNHLKGQTLLLSSFYTSAANKQHLPFLSDEKATCKQIIKDGIVEKVICDEDAYFKPLSEYGYVVHAIGKSKIEMLSSEPASSASLYKTPKRESLVFKYNIRSRKTDTAESEARVILKHICDNSKNLITKDAASYVHKLVYTIREMKSESSVENVYQALKKGEICNSGKKAESIYLDALRFASSGGSISLLSKLAISGEMPFIDSVLWATLMPFTSYVEEESISGAIPLLDQKNVASRQFLLGTSAMAYKYCSINPECESTQGVKDLSSKLKQLLGNKCHTENQEEDSKVLTVLKSFGNMGFVGESAKDILDCALTPENKVHIRIAAIEAFRRTPCKDEISQKLLDIYTSKSEHDELRIAALVSLSRCASRGIVKSVVETYSTETSRQVEVFTWSFLENIRSSSDPLKAKARKYLGYVTLKEPYSTDITKFSRNFESSFLSDIFNFGYGLEANIIHSSDSFLPRSSNLGLNLNLFGNQIHALEVGARVEDLEHILEKVFGPVGIFSVIDSEIRENLIQLLPETLQRFKRSADSYQTKIDALSERLGYKRNTVPRGTTYLRILGHELGLFHLNKESLKRVAGIKVNDLLKSMANLKDIDTSKNLLFIDLSVLFPSITGRAYKLASNGSLTLGLKADGKIDLRQPNFPFPAADIDGKFQPSILSEATAAFTIHSEDFEPGVKVETIFNAGLDYDAKIEIKDGRLFHLKINRENKKTEILNMKRTLYFMNHRGQNEMAKPDSYNLNYCTKYLQKIIGAKYCASLTFPHFYENGKFKIPFVRAMEASISVEQTDPSMQGYEFLLEIPDFKNAREKRFKFLVDTPNSSKDRKLSIEVNLRHPNDNQCTLQGSFYSPFYTLDINAVMLNSEDKILLTAEAVGDKQRKYAVSIDAAKVVKGARLVEYHPKVSISSPTMRPVEFDGTLIFHKGRKEHLSINIESRSFGSPFLIKGRVAKEGEAINLSSNWKFSYEFNATAFEQIHRIHGGIGYIVNEGLFIDLGHHYEPDGRSYESITVNAMVKNIKIFDRLSFSIDSNILLAEHQDLNTMLKWDFSFKPWHHFKSDLEFRYGENFADDTHLVRMTVVQELHGDLNSFQKLNTDNKLGLTISCLGIDESAQLTAIWDFVDQPKLIFVAGIKTQKDKEVKIEFNYRHLEVEPLKLATDMIITFNTYKFKYSDEVIEIAPKEYKYKSVIEPVAGRMITSNFIYRIKSSDHVHHEFEGDIIFPGFSEPVHQKGYFQLSDGTFKLNSNTDFGRNNKYIIDAELKRNGKNEIKLTTPFIEGNLIVDASDLTKTVSADFRTRTKDDRRIVVAGTLTPGDTIAFDLDVEWDADRDSGKKVAINIKINKQAEEGNKHIIITGSINYIGSVIIDISGKISADVIRGPHFFKAEFSGSMEPMAIEISHEIKDGHMNSVIRFLRRGVEKLRQDIKGKLIQRGFSHFETEFGIFSSSPFKAFDGKEIFFRLLFDSKDDIRSFISAYRIKLAEGLGYEGKVDYERKRGYPGHIRSNLAVTIHNRIIYEGTASVDYGNGKYSLKSSFTPISKKKIHFLASFEHAARFAAFHHSIATNFQYLQTVEVNAVADLRNMEDTKVHSDLGVNTHKLYDVNSTIKMRSMFDFEGEMTIFSKITPSFRIISKSQTSAQITKYDMNLDIDSKTVLTGSGELKKRKQKFNGDIIFKYKEKEILALTVNQDGKGKNERNYLIKLKFPSRLYTANVKINREKKGLVTYTTKFCRNEELCIEVDVVHKEYENGNEYVIKYKRDDVEFGIERIRESSSDEERFHTVVVFNGNHRYGYDVKYGPGSFGPSLTLGLILPSREIYTKGTFKFSLSKPRIKLEFTADGKNNPDRTLATDIEFENHLNDNSPSKFHIVITHPIFEKPIEIHLSGNYDSSTSKYFTSEASLDYSNDPNDKLIGKLSLERVSSVDEYSGQMVINTYHLDDQHLDFVIKVNLISNKNEDTFSIKYFWKKENNVDEEAHIIGSYLEKEKQFFFEYKRPKLSYRLDGKIADPVSIFNNTWNVDLTSVYNGETTKAKLVTDEDCYKLMILDEGGDLSRIVELCINMKSRKMVSLITESYNDDGKLTFDYLFEVIQSDWNTIRIRNQADPEFLGKYLFLLTSLGDELEQGGVGSLPFYESPQYKIIKRAFTSKVLDPAKNFLVSEGPKFFKDMEYDATFLKNAAINYYKKLPPLHVIQEKSEEIRDYIGSIIKEIFSYYKSYFTTYLEYIDKFRSSVIEKCNQNSDCRSFVKSYQAEGFKGLLKEIRVFLLSLPERIIEFVENPSVEVQDYFKRSTDALKAFIEPLTKCKCGEIVVKVAKLSYEKLKPRVQALMSRLPHHYRRIKETISSNEYIREAMQLSKEMVIKLRERILNIDYEKLFIIARKYMEDYLSTLSPPSLKRVIKVNAISGEKGILDISIYSNVVTRIINRIESVVVSIADMSVRAGRHFNVNSIMAKIKRGLDFGYIPPYKAHAMIVDHQHFVTFDKEFYDFAGECNYLLTRDFEDGNFTLVLKQNVGDKAASIIVIKDETSIELNSGQTEVKAGDNTIDLPFLSKDIEVTRVGNTVVVDTKNGLKVYCNLVHVICTFHMSGWYYGKTAGLLGTYNYEKYDEFKRPKGQIANSLPVFAKSWELKKGCKTANLLSEVQVNKNSDFYKQCKLHFKDKKSPLAACFSEVSPESYFELCLKLLGKNTDADNSFCNAATAYVMECEKNYVDLNLPSKCLKCDAPDGSKKLEHGDRKKFEKLNKKSADIVFLVEDHDCNKVLLSDMNNLARSIEKELQNDGFRDIMFGLVGFDGSVGRPQTFTSKGNIFFGSRDMNSVAERLKLENKKSYPSRAFEAMKHAVEHHFRSYTTKSLVLLSCSSCKYDYTSLQYPVIQQILLERGVSLHIIRDIEIPIRKSTVKEKNIIGVDPNTVFHAKDVAQPDLVGEPELRSQVVVPKDLCITLSQDVNGSFFSTHSISKSSSEAKNWRSVFARRFLKSSQLSTCQVCDCTATRDHVPSTVCQPCETKRPQLPFSVGSTGILARTMEAFLYPILLLNLIGI